MQDLAGLRALTTCHHIPSSGGALQPAVDITYQQAYSALTYQRQPAAAASEPHACLPKEDKRINVQSPAVQALSTQEAVRAGDDEAYASCRHGKPQKDSLSGRPCDVSVLA